MRKKTWYELVRLYRVAVMNDDYVLKPKSKEKFMKDHSLSEKEFMSVHYKYHLNEFTEPNGRQKLALPAVQGAC